MIRRGRQLKDHAAEADLFRRRALVGFLLVLVALGGLASPTPLTWNSGGFAIGTGPLILSSTTALDEVEFRNPIDLNNAARTITVNDNASTFTDFATISGVISGTGGITKNGTGVLQLLGANTYVGSTSVTGVTRDNRHHYNMWSKNLLGWLPDEKTRVMSEVFLNRVFPAMRSAYPSEWLATVDKALAMNAKIYIPGHGFTEDGPVSRDELVAYRGALAYVINEATRLYRAGVPLADPPAQANWGEYASGRLASSQAATAIRKVYEELSKR